MSLITFVPRKLGMILHAFNPNTQEAECCEFLANQVCITSLISYVQSGLYSEILSQNTVLLLSIYICILFLWMGFPSLRSLSMCRNVHWVWGVYFVSCTSAVYMIFRTFLLCVWTFYQDAHICSMYMQYLQRPEASDSLELELEMVVSAMCWEQSPVLCKVPSHLSSRLCVTFNVTCT